MSNKDVSNIIESVKKQFLCCVPVKNIQWENIFDIIAWEDQELLINETVNAGVVLQYPLHIGYQKTFLKRVIDALEKKGAELHDCLYNAYGRLVSLVDSNQCYKHYFIGSGKIITLKENSNIISEGTTGLCTWQASVALSEWCLANEKDIQNKIVLELGSGIGLTGLVTGLYCKPKKYYFTDCHNTVLDVLCDNIKTNLKARACSSSNSPFSLYKQTTDSNAVLEVLKLPWEDVAKKIPELSDVELVLAADVVYDSSLFVGLSDAIKCFLVNSACKRVVLACTERNKDTLENFLRVLASLGLNIGELKLPSQKYFLWNTQTPIHIYTISV